MIHLFVEDNVPMVGNMDILTETNGPISKAVFSKDKVYRYYLSRKTGLPGTKKLAWLMLNPSTADAFKMDPTVTRCFNRTTWHQANEMIILNLFAMRSPYPKDLYHIDDPIGPLNDEFITQTLAENDIELVCAWGREKLAGDRATELVKRIPSIPTYCLGTNKDGSPVHPLHIPYEHHLVPFDIQ